MAPCFYRIYFLFYFVTICGVILADPPATSSDINQHLGSQNVSSADPGPVDDEHTDTARVPVPSMSGTSSNNRRPSRPLILRAASLILAPYHMMTPPHDKSNPDSGHHSGYIPDLLDRLETRLADRYPVKFQLYLPDDAMYGQLINGSWTGLIGELVKKSQGDDGADVAAFPMTVTSERQSVVTFLNPFKHGGITAVVKKPHLDDASRDVLESAYFNVLRPLTNDVWVVILASCLTVSGLLWLLNYFNPYEYGGRYNMGRGSEDEAETFNLTGALWFTFTTLQWQGFSRAPRAFSSKLLAMFWLTFVSLTIMTYTAAVVSSVFWSSTVHGRDLRVKPFTNVPHLIWAHDELGYDYGTAIGSSTFMYLMMGARGPQYDLMREYWQNTKTGGPQLVYTVEDGIARARAGKYAYVTDTLQALYYVNQEPCDLTMLDEVVGERSYGLAVRKDLPHGLTDALRVTLLEMTESGELDALEEKWWKQYGQCWSVSSRESDLSSVSRLMLSSPARIDSAMFWGPLLLISFGLLLSVFLGVGEILYFNKKGKFERSNHPGGQRFTNEETT